MVGTQLQAMHSVTEWSLSGAKALQAAEMPLRAKDPERYRSRGRRFAFGDLFVADISQTPVIAAPAAPNEQQQNLISITFVRAGGYDISEGGSVFRFGAGEVGYMHGWTQVAAESTMTSRVAMVSVQKAQLTELGVTVCAPVGGLAGLGRSSALRAPSLSFVLALTNQLSSSAGSLPSTPSAGDHSVEGVRSVESARPTTLVLTQLMAGLFLEDAGYRMDSADLKQGLRARADAVIAQQASDPEFTSTVLADQLSVSLRNLQRCYADIGSGPAEAIRQYRLERAIVALSPDASLGSVASVSEAAARAGFSSAKELRFALRSAYGLTPREVLAGHPIPPGLS